MTNKDRTEMAARKAVRESCRPLRRQLGYAERTINALAQKVEAKEREIVELKRANIALQNKLMSQ